MSSIAKTAFFVSLVTTLALIVFPLVSVAQLSTSVTSVTSLAKGTGVTGVKAAIVKVINFFLALVGLLAVIVLIIAGIRYIISLGDESAAEKAKRTILYAVIGLIVVGLSAVIVNFILAVV